MEIGNWKFSLFRSAGRNQIPGNPEIQKPQTRAERNKEKVKRKLGLSLPLA
jgi:hypothetical protein